MRGDPLFKGLDRWVGVPLVRLLGLFRSRRTPQALGPGGRLLVVKFSAMGDTLLLLPLLKSLRAQVGSAGRLEMVATPVNAAVLKDLPWLDAVHVLKPGDFLRAPWRIAGLVLRLRRAGFDWALDFDQWLRASALLSWASGARWRGGFSTPGQSKHALFHASTPNHLKGHEIVQFKALAQLAGLDGALVEPYNGFLLRQGFMGAAVLARGPRPRVLFHAGAGGARSWQREWPADRFAGLGLRLARERGAELTVSGSGEHELALAQDIAGGMDGQPVKMLFGSLAELVRELCSADLLVSGNTGVMHLAAGLGCPLVALHGPTSAVKWGPVADAPGAAQRSLALQAHVGCSPCLNLGFEYGCPYRPCMESFGVDEAFDASLRALGAP